MTFSGCLFFFPLPICYKEGSPKTNIGRKITFSTTLPHFMTLNDLFCHPNPFKVSQYAISPNAYLGSPKQII